MIGRGGEGGGEYEHFEDSTYVPLRKTNPPPYVNVIVCPNMWTRNHHHWMDNRRRTRIRTVVLYVIAVGVETSVKHVPLLFSSDWSEAFSR